MISNGPRNFSANFAVGQVVLMCLELRKTLSPTLNGGAGFPTLVHLDLVARLHLGDFVV